MAEAGVSETPLPRPTVLIRHLSDPLPPATGTAPSSPSSSHLDASSPAFSTLSHSTFASTIHDAGHSTPKLPFGLGTLSRGGSGSQVAMLEQARADECASPVEPSSPAAVEESAASMPILAGLGATGAGVVEVKDCGCDATGEDKDVGRLGHSTEVRTRDAKAARPALGSSTASSSGFDRFGIPTDEAMREAETSLLVGEGGVPVSFGSLVHERGRPTVVVFLRHLWCGLCAQYVVALSSASSHLSTLNSLRSATNSSTTSSPNSSLAQLSPALGTPPLYILLISSGSPSLIPIYRARLDCPFPLYVDKGRKLYKIFGMTRKSLDAGKDKDKGSYVTLKTKDMIVESVKTGLAMGAGLKGTPGNQSQLGGEFVLESVDGEIRCLFASRMSTTRNHSEVRDLFLAAGIHLNPADDASVFGAGSEEQV